MGIILRSSKSFVVENPFVFVSMLIAQLSRELWLKDMYGVGCSKLIFIKYSYSLKMYVQIFNLHFYLKEISNISTDSWLFHIILYFILL